jgi:hypothetical protein
MLAYLGFASREDILARAGADPLALFAGRGIPQGNSVDCPTIANASIRQIALAAYT